MAKKDYCEVELNLTNEQVRALLDDGIFVLTLTKRGGKIVREHLRRLEKAERRLEKAERKHERLER